MSTGWAAAVFARDEAPSLRACLLALAKAAEGKALHVSVLLNGSRDGSAAIAIGAMRECGLRGAVHAIPQGDKSNAINQFIHRLRPPSETVFCLDGYVAVAPDALRLLAARLDANPHAHAAAAVPSQGRSAAGLRRAMIEAPGLHGSLFALRGTFVDRIADLGLRLPVGFYRGDGLLGSFALHDLDAVEGGWDGSRIAVEPAASWTLPQRHAASRHWQRRLQQGRGRLQWQAIRAAIYPGGFSALPADADRATLDWIAADPARRPSLWRDPFAALALARMHPEPGLHGAALLPALAYQCR